MDDIKMLLIHDFLEEEQTNNQQSCIDNFTITRLSAIASVAVGNYRWPIFFNFLPIVISDGWLFRHIFPRKKV